MKDERWMWWRGLEERGDKGIKIPNELHFPSLVLILILGLLCVVAVSAATVVFPVAQNNCGSFGNVIAAIQHMRNEGMDKEHLKVFLKQSSDACVEANGKDGCILQTKEEQDMLNDMIEMIYKNPPIDPTDFGFQVYTQCLQANKGKEM